MKQYVIDANDGRILHYGFEDFVDCTVKGGYLFIGQNYFDHPRASDLTVYHLSFTNFEAYGWRQYGNYRQPCHFY